MKDPSRRSKAEIAPLQLKEQLAQSMGRSPVIVDVREPDEYDDWRIEGSLNIPLKLLMSGQGLEQLPKGKEVVALCARGIRSAGAVEFLLGVGFKAKHLTGGLAAWNKVYDDASVSLGPDGGKMYQIRRIGRGCASYIVGYQGECVVVDPSVHVEEYYAVANREGLEIEHVADTHLHADHISGARALAYQTGAQLYLNPLDRYHHKNFVPLNDGDTISLGNGSFKIEAIYTPGHTKGSTCFLAGGKALLSGDTLFIEGIARPDLHDKAEEFALDLYRTYHARLNRVPDDGIILPAHFSSAVKLEFGKPVSDTLRNIRSRIPLLRASKSGFTQFVLANVPPKPPNHQIILRINRGEITYEPAAFDSSAFDELEIGPNRCAVRT